MLHPIQSCSSQELRAALQKGEYDRYMTLLKGYSIHEGDWFNYQVLGIRVLVSQKRASSALRFIKSLRAGVIDVHERSCAHAEYLFYSWLLEGRNASKLLELDAILKDCKHSCHSLKNLALRTGAMKLLLGLEDARQKTQLVCQYQRQIEILKGEGFEDEAYFCLLELVDLLTAKPYPDLSKALELLEGNWLLLVENGSTYKASALKVLRERLKTEISFKTDGSPVSHNSFIASITQLQRLGADRDVAQNLAMYGAILLKNGDATGRKFINKSIRVYQKLKDDEGVIVPATHLISWLKLTGNLHGINSYLELISKPVLGRVRPEVQTSENPDERDMVMSATLDLCKAEMELKNNNPLKARETLQIIDRNIQLLGHSELSLRVAALLDYCSLCLGEKSSPSQMRQLIDQWVELGYVHKALEYVLQRLRLEVHDMNCSTTEVELSNYLEMASSLTSKIMNIQLAETLGELFEVAALAYFYKNKGQSALSLLHDANLIYSEYGLRPRVAINYLCQARVNEFQFSQKGKLVYLERAMVLLEEACSLFRSMNYRIGVIETQKFKARLTNENEFFKQSHNRYERELKQDSASLLDHVAGIQKSVYRNFSAYVSSHTGTMKILITQPLNHN